MKVQRIMMGIWKPIENRRERKRWNKVLEEKKEDQTSGKYQAGQFIDQKNEYNTIQGYFFRVKFTILPPL